MQPVTTTTTDGMVTVEGPSGIPMLPQGVLKGGSLLAGSLAPSEIITLMGNGIGPASAVQPLSSPSSTVLGGTSVLLDGTPAPLLYAGQNQINAIVPCQVAWQTVTQMQVSSAGFGDRGLLSFRCSFIARHLHAGHKRRRSRRDAK